MDEISIERVGGLAGMGLPGSRMRSHGRVRLSKLGAADRGFVERAFAAGDQARPAGPADTFEYRLTRQTDRGPHTVKLHAPSLPPDLEACLADELT